MDQAQIDSIKAEVNAGVDTAANVAEVIAPQYAGFIVLGQAVAKALPSLYEDVMKLINKEAPTQDEKDSLAKAIASLAKPETL